MTVAFGEFELDPAFFELRRAGVQVPLEPQAFDVLWYLARHRDRVVSKEELMDQIWGGRFVTEAAVTSRIKQARHAVGDDGRTQQAIRTVHGRGYRFVAALRPSTAAAGGAEPSLTGSAPPGLSSLPRPDESGRAAPTSGPQRTAPDPYRTALVGRAAELAIMERLLARVRVGSGSTVVISGEPGIGKTALLGSVQGRAVEAGGCVVVGRGVENGGPFRPLAEALMGPWRSPRIREADALQPFRRALDRVLPGWGRGGGDATADLGVDPVLLIAEGLVQILSGLDAEFGVLVIDDAQDADPDTVAVLEQLAAASTTRPVLVVLARSDWPRSLGLDRIASAAGTVRLPLGRLDVTDLHSLITADRELPPDTVAMIVERSEGLPVVAVELAVASAGTGDITWAVPHGFAALAEARLLALTDDERHLLAAAAVLGQEPDWDLVPEIADLDDAIVAGGLRQAVRLHLLTADGGGLRWRHELIRQVVWATLLPPERRALTQAAVRVLLARGTAQAPAQAAELMMVIGDVDRAVGVWLKLAHSALAAGGLRTADELLERASATGVRRVAVAIERVGLLLLVGRPVEALEVGMPRLAEARGDEHAELCFRLARAAGAAGRWAESEQLVVRAGRIDDPRSAILLCDAAHARSRMVEAGRYAETAIARARAEGDVDVLCEALCAQARIFRPHDLSHAGRLFAEAGQLASEHGLLPWRVEALLGLATLELLTDEESPRLYEAQQTALDAGLLRRVAQADLLLADHVLLADGPSGSAAAASRVGEFGRLARLSYFHVAGEILLAARSAVAGDGRAAEFRLARLDAGPDVPQDIGNQVLGVQGQAALVRHDLAGAAELLDAAMRPVITASAAAPFALFGAWALVSTLVRSDASDVRTLLAEQPAGRRRANRGALRYADAVVAGRAGDRAAAEGALTDGDWLLAPIPWWRRFLRTYALEAAVTEGWADAVTRLRVDLAAFERGGEEPMARLARDLLRRAGAPTRRGRGDAVVQIALRAVGVTSREMDVLRLIQQRLPNTAIAQRLFLSPRTVETHVTNLLSKSGAGNRGELVSWAAATGD